MQRLVSRSKHIIQQIWLNTLEVLPSHKQARWGIGTLCVLCATVAIGFVPVPEDSQTEAQTTITESIATPELKPVSSNDSAKPFIREERIGTGDSITNILERMAINDTAFKQFIKIDPQAQSLFRLNTGNTVQAAIDPSGKLIWLRYTLESNQGETQTNRYKLLQITRQNDQFVAQELALEGTRHVITTSGTVTGSFYQATDEADIPDAIAAKIVDLMSSQIDFHSDLKKGDQFRVMYEVFTHKGKYINSGKVLAVEFVNQGKSLSAFWFADAQNEGAYYDKNGNNIRKTFARSPVSFTRISSGFSMRLHPIYQTMRQHQGVDYAAPIGTPVMATSDANIEFIGTQGGYGNVIILKHHGQYSTVYAHLNGFAKGLKKGDKIQQGTIIGYVGSTGSSTGPHLHYEIRVAGKAVDPQKIALPYSDTPRTGRQRYVLEQATAPLKNKLALVKRVDEAGNTTQK